MNIIISKQLTQKCGLTENVTVKEIDRETYFEWIFRDKENDLAKKTKKNGQIFLKKFLWTKLYMKSKCVSNGKQHAHALNLIFRVKYL